MPLLTIVEAWTLAALQTATGERLEDGTFVASVPGLEGVIATGADVHECLRSLYERLDDYVRVGLANGLRIPAIGGVDLNTDAARILATYHPTRIAAPASHREFYADPAALRRGLGLPDQPATGG